MAGCSSWGLAGDVTRGSLEESWILSVVFYCLCPLHVGLESWATWSGPGWDGELRFPSCSDTGPPFVAFSLVGTLGESFFTVRTLPKWSAGT